MTEPNNADIITATIAEFSRISGNTRSRIYELLAEGELQSVKIGKRRLIVVDSYRRMIQARLSDKSVPLLSRGRAETTRDTPGLFTKKG